jgi:hypothetical protein
MVGNKAASIWVHIVGIGLFAVSVPADAIRLGGDSGFGNQQMTVALAGIVIMAIGLVFARKSINASVDRREARGLSILLNFLAPELKRRRECGGECYEEDCGINLAAILNARARQKWCVRERCKSASEGG